MNIYAIYIDKKDARVWDEVKEYWRDRNYILDDHIAFIAPPEAFTTAEEISEKIGVSGNKKRGGIVMELHDYSGFASRGLWQWLNKVSL